ncbi:lycopene cyclase domain-containing protein [Patescibacteria group bacterium]|nr:lycopene cyclase domain-containing protein [Patescibacteria group bacterium]
MAQSVYLDFLFWFFAAPITLLGIWIWTDWWYRRKTLGTMIACTIVFGFFCDLFAVRTGLWQYDTGQPNLGIWIFEIPIEEFLFYILFPILVFSVWCAVERLWRVVLRTRPYKGGTA